MRRNGCRTAPGGVLSEGSARSSSRRCMSSGRERAPRPCGKYPLLLLNCQSRCTSLPAVVVFSGHSEPTQPAVCAPQSGNVEAGGDPSAAKNFVQVRTVHAARGCTSRLTGVCGMTAGTACALAPKCRSLRSGGRARHSGDFKSSGKEEETMVAIATLQNNLGLPMEPPWLPRVRGQDHLQPRSSGSASAAANGVASRKRNARLPAWEALPSRRIN